MQGKKMVEQEGKWVKQMDREPTKSLTVLLIKKELIWKQGTGERVRNQKGVNKQRTTKKMMTKRKVDDDKKLL